MRVRFWEETQGSERSFRGIAISYPPETQSSGLCKNPRKNKTEAQRMQVRFWEETQGSERSFRGIASSYPPETQSSGLCVDVWSWQCDSNTRPADYESAALPTELCQHQCLKILAHGRPKVNYFSFSLCARYYSA